MFHCWSSQFQSVTTFAFFQWNTACGCRIERWQSADSDTWSCGYRLRRPSPIPERLLWAHPSDRASGIFRPWPGPWFRLCWWRTSVHSTCTTDWCWPGHEDVDWFINRPIGAQLTNLPGPIRLWQPPTGPRSIHKSSVPTCPHDLHDSVWMRGMQLPIYRPFFKRKIIQAKLIETQKCTSLSIWLYVFLIFWWTSTTAVTSPNFSAARCTTCPIVKPTKGLSPGPHT